MLWTGPGFSGLALSAVTARRSDQLRRNVYRPGEADKGLRWPPDRPPVGARAVPAGAGALPDGTPGPRGQRCADRSREPAIPRPMGKHPERSVRRSRQPASCPGLAGDNDAADRSSEMAESVLPCIAYELSHEVSMKAGAHPAPRVEFPDMTNTRRRRVMPCRGHVRFGNFTPSGLFHRCCCNLWKRPITTGLCPQLETISAPHERWHLHRPMRRRRCTNLPAGRKGR